MGRYSLFAVFEKEPAVVAGVIRAVLHTLVLLNVILLDAPQLAGISLMVELVLTLFVRASVTPNINVNTATQTTTVTTDKP